MINYIKHTARSILLWSQKYTKADMLYLAKSGSWVIFGQAGNGLLAFALIIAFANLLPKETYGTYRYILSIVGVLGIFTLTGMNNAVARGIAKGNDGILQVSVRHQLLWNSLMLGALASVAGYYFFRGNYDLGVSFFILGLTIPYSLAFNTYGAYLEGKKRYDIGNILSVISTCVYSVLTLLALFVTDNILFLICVYGISTLIPSYICYRYVLKRFNVPKDTEDTHDTLAYGRELTYIRFLGPIFSHIDKIILWHFWGPSQLAVYALATALPNRAILFIKSWVAIGFPKFSEKTIQEIDSAFSRRIIQGLSIGLLVFLVYIVISPYIFMYLLPQYMEGLYYSQILAISFIFALPNRYISLILTSQRFSKELFINGVLSSVIGIILYIVLGIIGGLSGLVTAQVLYTFFGMILGIISWKRTVKISLKKEEK